MNSNLLAIDTLLAVLREGSNLYLFPMLIGMALLIVLTALVMDRGRAARHDDERRPPRVPQALAAAAAGNAAAPALLVVDDSAVARAKLRRLFEGAGYTVAVASDGLEALETLASRFFSVLVTDLEMPQMSGIELIASVQGSLETEDLPIIAITGHDELQARARDYEGLYGIFRKPWNDRELLRRVQTLATLRRPSASVAPRPAVRREAESLRAASAETLH